MRTSFVLIATIPLIVWGCAENTVKKAADVLPSVRVTLVTACDVSIPVHVSGILMPDDELKLSFKTGGIIANVPVREGDRVRKGDLLASLNMSEINARVALAEGVHEKAMRDLSRVENLYRDTVATLEQYQNASTALDVARSNLDIARFNRTHSTINAPSDGVILRQLARASELVAPGYPVFLFGSTGKNWKVKAGIADRDFVRINRGDSAVVTFDAWPGISFPAAVEQVGELADQQTGTYEAELSVTDPGYKLGAGFVAGVDIFPAERKRCMLVPVASVVEADGLTGYVFAVRDDNTVEKVKARIAAILGSGIALEGFDEEEILVVTEGAPYIKDGDKVRIIK